MAQLEHLSDLAIKRLTDILNLEYEDDYRYVLDAAKYVIDRVFGTVRPARYKVALSKIRTSADAQTVIDQILCEVAAGTIAPREGVEVAGIVGAWLKVRELADVEERISVLEAATGIGQPTGDGLS